MKVVIVGAGGIGAYYGAKLMQADHQLVLVARGEHLQAMQTQGLRVTHPDFHFHQAVNACSLSELLEQHTSSDFDLIILALKADQTIPTLHSLKAWLKHTNTPVLSIQNGVDNELAIAAQLGQQRTIGGLAVRIGGHITAPATVEAAGIAQIIMGAWPEASANAALQQRLIPITKAFNQAGIPTTLSPSIQHELWKKLLINNGVNPLSALTELDTQALTQHPVYGKTVYNMMQEVAQVASADQVTLSADDVDAMYQLICQFDAIKTSMLIDKEKGRPLELAAISGAVIKRAEQLNIDVPLTALVHSLLSEPKSHR